MTQPGKPTTTCGRPRSSYLFSGMLCEVAFECWGPGLVHTLERVNADPYGVREISAARGPVFCFGEPPTKRVPPVSRRFFLRLFSPRLASAFVQKNTGRRHRGAPPAGLRSSPFGKHAIEDARSYRSTRYLTPRWGPSCVVLGRTRPSFIKERRFSVGRVPCPPRSTSSRPSATYRAIDRREASAIRTMNSKIRRAVGQTIERR